MIDDTGHPARQEKSLTDEQLNKFHAYQRAANYLSAGRGLAFQQVPEPDT